ncbi:hypothetical protein H8356DRAFT_1681015 [Neocallimastix lanati (nom. inval.)]|uniref:Uncharacterized protein n=1 Tax=Neocallimastix californiae TaxID=1754190 RepID=A0A1Y2ENQ3_9FUNG|nr:hypothetical protein H8356DRAFT_1681015 [Neocallimastix sp. JGI-2020a]ORY73159.1 hypothetical protein LY90DRAFT_179407 [Neocallimastix californiae]|eukprot:ORY73159.1 hypothetical protein LY90DRAFT_179407 [Neocallimastix californiae]
MNDTLLLKWNLQIFKQIHIINFIFKNFKNYKRNFHKWYSDLKLFLASEELGDYILKNIKDINTNEKTFI